MVQFCSISLYKQLRNFDDEVERGCQYKVSANIPHNTDIAMVIGPYVELPISGIKYQIIPINAIKSRFFKIKKGEIGDLVDTALAEGMVKFFRIVWKQAIELYYINPTVCPLVIRGTPKYLQLEDLFSVQKIEPEDSKTTRS
ncbi:MAG: hypothetical protein AABY16_04495 [Nanoarchaeota archaeon]